MTESKKTIDRDRKLSELRAALEEGEKSPIVEDYSLEKVVERLRNIPRK